MIFRRVAMFLVALSATTLRSAEHSSDPAFSFQDVKYFYRWSHNQQYEFTPAKQEDLDHWSDMITINGYPSVEDGEKLAAAANTVLGNYQSSEGKILKTSSVPAKEERPAEHFIAVFFTRPDFCEAAFARFKLADGKGYSFVYSHRFYGEEAKDRLTAWLKANGDKVEKSLMDWDPNLEPWPANS